MTSAGHRRRPSGCSQLASWLARDLRWDCGDPGAGADYWALMSNPVVWQRWLDAFVELQRFDGSCRAVLDPTDQMTPVCGRAACPHAEDVVPSA